MITCDTPLSPLCGGNGEEVIIVVNSALVGLVAVILVGYLVSGFLHPFRACRSCGGTGVHRGAIYRRASRNCASCGGKGRFRRVGAPPQGKAFGESRRR